MNARSITLPALAALLGGCASTLSGVGGSETLSCKAPAGVVCTSVSGVYANASANTARETQVSAPAASIASMAPALYSTNAITLGTDKPETPSSTVLRSSPRVLRLWIAPWEDSDGDLYEASTVHVVIDHGRWLLNPLRIPNANTLNRADGAKPPAAGVASATPTTETAIQAGTPAVLPAIPPSFTPNIPPAVPALPTLPR